MKLSAVTVLLAAGLTAVTLSGEPVRKQEPQRIHFSRETWNDGEETSKKVIDPVASKDAFSAVVYNNQNGLPTSEANDIAETKDGFIWIGSYSGLIRYDGNTFERMDSTTGIGNVGCLFVDRKDRLWVGTNDSGIAMLDKDNILYWKEEDGLKSLNISKITQDQKGNIYVGTAAGIYIFDENLNMTAMKDPKVRNMYVEYLLTGRDGEIYGISNDGAIFTIRNGEITSYYRTENYGFKGVIYMYPDPDDAGKLYFGTQDSTIYHVAKDESLTVTETWDISPLSGVMGIKQIDGRLWIYGRNGIGMLRKNVYTYLGNLPLNNSVGNVMDDYEGNLWFTSTRQGIMKIVPNQFSDVFERYGLDPQVVNTTCVSGRNLFIGTDTGLIITKENEVLTEFPLETAVRPSGEELECKDLLELLEGSRIRSIISDSRGRLWISTWRACGLICYDHGTAVVFTDQDGLISDHIRTVLERRDGSFLVILSGGVNIIRDGRVTGFYGLDEGVVNPEILTVAEAPNGDIVLGTDGSGIYIINDERVRSVDTKNGLSSGIIMRIKWDEKRRLYWIVTSNSIAYMTENYEVTTIRNFPYSNNFDLYENSNEDMWILSSNGIYVVAADELLANEEISAIHYSMADGIPCITTANSYSELTDSGDLYIAGTTGVAKVNMEKPLENVINLKMGVAYIDADGSRYYLDENGQFHLPAEIHKLTVDSHVFTYALTNPIVEYRLDGFDTEYTRVSRHDLGPVTYTNLPGGRYSFVIQLKDSQDRVGKRVSVPIIIEKALYEQTWFYVLATFAGLVLITALTSVYVKKKTTEMEQKNHEEVQKARLHTELKTAGQIQESMLPHTFPSSPEDNGFDLYASMNPAREVGGDFYDFFLIDPDHLCMVIADVSGKGIPASLYMVLSKSVLKTFAMVGKNNTAEILTKANEALCTSEQEVEMFVTVWIGILEISTGTVTAANGGHEYPAIMHNGEFTLMHDKHGLVLGGMEHSKYKEYEFRLEPGDKLFVYTDGVPEATDSENRLFGTDRMLEALNRNPEGSPKEVLHEVRVAIKEFVKEAEQFDDLTMMCIEYKGITKGAGEASESCETDRA
ncbi:MAG: SpoIIE family protein phosphatase [Solobacterium sp.]|nr:SpoIIE family protein phosphatase [Solobacterium sp.]